MPNLVIVALPSEDDYIHKVSSEKVPHMTLLFLGEVSKVSNLSSIIEFVEHASKTSLTRFGLEVERRAELGEDQADVLFFSKTKWSGYEDISTFRSHLLKNDNIRTAYDSTEQFPEWIPHITLGYPDSPAKEDTRDYPGITYVSFDRIAVWTEEFEGIEFSLKAYEWDTAVAMGDVVQNILAHVSEKSWGSYKESDYSIEQWHAACLVHLHDGPPTSKSQCKLPVKTPNGALNRNGVHAAAAALAGARSPLKASPEQKAKAASALRRYYSQLGETPPDSLAQSAIDDILEHHGVKGQKWGVRRRRDSGGSGGSKSKAERRADKADAKLAKTLSSDRRQYALKRQLHNTIAPMVQSKIYQLNNKPEYVKAIQEGTFKDPNHPTTKKYINDVNKTYINEMNNYLKGFQSGSGRKVVRAELDSTAFNGFTLRLHDKPGAKHEDSNVVKIEYIKDENGAIVGFEIVPDSLTQSAIGDILEHHGVKGMKWGVRRKATVGAQEVIVSDRRKKLKTTGGKGYPATSEAIRARTTAQIAKKSGVKAISNADLQAYNNRLNLEQNFHRLSYQDKSAGKKFVDKMLLKKGPGLAKSGAEMAMKDPRVRKKIATGAAAVAMRAAVVAA